MNEDNKKDPAPTRVFQFATEARDQARRFPDLRNAVLNWVSKNVVSLSESERNAPHYEIHDHNLGIAQYDRGGEHFFAIRYARGRQGSTSVPQETAALKVLTEIVIRAGEKDLDLYVTRWHQRRKFARLTEQDQRIKPPDVLGAIAGMLSIAESRWPLSPTLTEMHPNGGDFVALGRLILDPHRQFPVIISLGAQNGDTPLWDKQSLESLARQTYGFAHVVHIPFELIDRFQGKIGSKWHFSPGRVRQFNKGFKPGDVRTAHPILKALSRSPEEREEQVGKHIHDILAANVDRKNTGTILNFDSVSQPVIDRALAMHADDMDPQQLISLLTAKLEAAQRAAMQAEDLALEALAENEKQAATIERLTSSKPAEEPTPKNGHKPADKKLHWKVASFEFGIPVPDSIQHVAAWAKEYFPESLVLCKPFLDECESLKDFSPARTKSFYKMLSVMGIYYGAHYSEDLKRRREEFLDSKGSTLIAVMKEFGFEAVKQGHVTLSKYRTEYQAQDREGTRWNLDWHFKDGSADRNPRNLLRLYYTDSEIEPKPLRGKPCAIIGKGPGHLPIVSG